MTQTLSLRRTMPLLLPLAMIGLSGCATVDRMKTSSIPMDDYRKRHPILMAETAQKLDIFPSPQIRGLDRRSAGQVAEFAELYRASGEGPITIFLPAGGQAPAPRERAVILPCVPGLPYVSEGEPAPTGLWAGPGA